MVALNIESVMRFYGTLFDVHVAKYCEFCEDVFELRTLVDHNVSRETSVYT